MEKAMESKRLLLAIIAALVLAVGLVGLTACGGSSSSSDSGSAAEESEATEATEATADFDSLDPVVLIAADSTAQGSVGNQWQLAFKESIEEITGGKITVDYHGNGDLGGDADAHRQLQANDIQIDVAQPATFTSFVPACAVFDAPMAFSGYDADTIDGVLNGDNDFTKGLQESFESKQMHILGWLQDGTYRQTTSNKELKTLEDFKGFQIRTMENSNHMAFWTALGAEPTPLAFAELYFALQNGTVQGQENATDTCVNSNFQEVQKYLCRTNHILYANAMVISKDCWDNLDPAYQAAIEQAVAESIAKVRPAIGTLDTDSEKTMVDGGMEVITYDDQFVDDVLALDGVQALYKDISTQTDGLSDTMVAELQKAGA